MKIFTQTPSAGKWDETPGRSKASDTPGRGGETPGTSRGEGETPGRGGVTPSARIWEATPSYVPQGAATPTNIATGTPGHGTSKFKTTASLLKQPVLLWFAHTY